MGSTNLVFEVRYGGRFDRNSGCEYVGGDVVVHHESYDPDKLSYIDLEAMLKEYGYKSGDLMYFKHPDKSLVDGLYLITSDHDVLYMVASHTGHFIVHIYIVSFEEVGANECDEEEYEEDDGGRSRVDWNDPWWADKLSDDDDLFDVDVDDTRDGGGDGAGPSTVNEGTSNTVEDEGTDNSIDAEYEFDDDNDGNVSDDETDISDSGEEDGVHVEEVDASKAQSDGQLGRSLEDDEADDGDINSECGRSDILVSPVPSDEDDGVTSFPNDHDFHAVDLQDPHLKLKMKFTSIQVFREAVREYNLKRGKDIRFKKNERRKCIVVCRDDKCGYRVYARRMEDEDSFQIRSLQPKHVCGRKYKNSIVNSTWIANKLIDKFRIQPNMPLTVLQHEVKEKWRVDVTESMMYRARRKAGKKVYGKLEAQYGRLWDYCEMLRRTNIGTRVFMKVERHNLGLPPKFQRIYVSLSAMKKGFLDGCRPVIGVDGCFLKGPFKGQLLAAVGRDGNNNMYPIAFAVVEAETKDSWTWFLATLVSDLGAHEQHCRPTFISDRQKVSLMFTKMYMMLCFYICFVG